MPRVIVGERFGKWEVMEEAQLIKQKVLCRCDCGTVRKVCVANMKNGLSLSCGCVTKARNIAQAHVVEGVRLTKTRLYGVWATMRSRCNNPNFPAYRRYGARGIKVCDRWRNSFLHFLEDMGYPPPGYTIERIDNDGNYEPENCRWATRREQGRNQSTNHVGVINGERMCVADASERYGVNYRTILSRMGRGFSMEEAVFFKGDLAKAGAK